MIINRIAIIFRLIPSEKLDDILMDMNYKVTDPENSIIRAKYVASKFCETY